MSNEMSEEQLHHLATRRVAAKKSFYGNLAFYLIVNALLVLIWAATGRGYPWFLWVLGFWGLGVISHFLGVFVFSKQTNWERGQVEKEMERLRRSEN